MTETLTSLPKRERMSQRVADLGGVVRAPILLLLQPGSHSGVTT